MLCITVFDLEATPSCALQLAGETDNAGNSYVVSRMMTTKWPLAAILMEVTIQVRSRQLDVALDWIPRLQNAEADAITNEDYRDFDTERRIETSVEAAAAKFVLLPRLLIAGEKIVESQREAKATKAEAAKIEETEERKRDRPPARRWKKPLSKRLRATDPW